MPTSPETMPHSGGHEQDCSAASITSSQTSPQIGPATPHMSPASASRVRGMTRFSRTPILSATEWQNYRSMRLRLTKLPSDLTTWEIHNSFRAITNVAFVEIFENRQGERSGKAVVCLEPPPKRNLWESGICVITRTSGRSVKAAVEIERNGFKNFNEMIGSPVGKRIAAMLNLDIANIQFGVMSQPGTMMKMQTVQGSKTAAAPRLTIDFKRMRLQFHFAIGWTEMGVQAYNFNGLPTTGPHEYRAEIKFSQLKHLVRQVLPEGGCALIIALDHPALFFRKVDDVKSTHSADRLNWAEWDRWHRQINIMADSRGMREAVVTLEKVDQYIDIGRWMTYRFEMNALEASRWLDVEQNLQDYNIKTLKSDSFEVIPGKQSDFRQVLDESAHREGPSGSALELLGAMSNKTLTFDVRYQLEVCISRGVLVEQNIDRDFIQQLATLGPDHGRMILEFLMERGTRVYNPSEIFTDKNALAFYPNVTADTIPEYCALVRKAIVTPTTVHYSTPAVETNNRVLREYKDLKDRFLRVQFADELPEGRVNATADAKKNDEVFTRVFRCLKNGIRIGNRHYKLLAWGNSQLRENGAFFFAETAHVSCDDIRKWMGDFAHIKNPAKYAARLGQCFSTTRLISGFSVPQLVKSEDIERNGHCFTDGVGKISSFWAQMIAEHLQLDAVPSAFQFRMGGCKGMLVTWPDAKRGEVHIRPSQEKFSGAVFNGLEIIRCSSFSTATLNRQSITILSTIGVPDAAFHRLLGTQLAGINRAMESEKEAKAQLKQAIDEHQTTLKMADMIESGFMGAREPFVWSLLRLWRSWSVKTIKEKARITVEQSAFLLGCVDETGILRGHASMTEKSPTARQDRALLPQIFLQIPTLEDKGDFKVITGLCVVGRNPSLHPGDIRVVEAVDVAELRHLKNVVVFPKTGARDVPSMCSGGDLDGDDFFVFWDQSLVPPRTTWNYPPMDFAAPSPPLVDKVTMPHLMSFFVVYMKNDSLPRIAHAHLGQADHLDLAARNPKCLELAELHSRAVDYVKTGTEARMPKSLNPRAWPHFMDKHHKRTYHSHRVLGQLYDEVQTVDFQPAYDMPFDKRILTRFELDGETLKQARRIKSRYDMAMRQLMGQREIRTEFEVWSAFVLSKPRFGSDYKQSEEVGREIAALKARFKDLCVRAATGGGGVGTARDLDKVAPFAAAMYKVTQEEVRIAIHECGRDNVSTGGRVFRRRMEARSMPLISFPWIFYKELGEIATGQRGGGAAAAAAMRASVDVGAGASAAAVVEEEKEKEKDAAAAAAGQGGEAVAAAALGVEDVADMQYVRTAEGVVYHRGEVINLFGHDSDADEDEEDAALAGELSGIRVDGNDADAEDRAPPAAGLDGAGDEDDDDDNEEFDIETEVIRVTGESVLERAARLFSV